MRSFTGRGTGGGDVSTSPGGTVGWWALENCHLAAAGGLPPPPRWKLAGTPLGNRLLVKVPVWGQKRCGGRCGGTGGIQSQGTCCEQFEL